MDLRHLVTFEAIVREGSFARAARALGCSQPTVTLHVQELERELGVPLFHRRGRGASLGDAGLALASRSRPVLEGLDTLKRTMAELRAGVAGELRIGSIEPAASRRLVPLLAAFCRERPGLKVRLEVGGTGTISGQVAEGRLDLGLCSLPSPELPLRFEPLFVERMALLLPARHPLARGRRVRARDLHGHRLLLTEQGCAYRRRIETALREAGAEVECRMEIGSLSGLVSAVQGGLGIAIVPELAARPAPPRTRLRELVEPDVSLSVGLVRRENGLLASPAVSAFLSRLPEVKRAPAAGRKK
jgi:DNA-binding transcriptional LysR family regulator